MNKPRATKSTAKPTGKPTTGPSTEPGTETAPSDGGKVAPKAKTATPEKAPKETAPDPTRYGDWEKKGRAIDF